MKDHNQKVSEYYDVTLPYYRYFWHGNSGSNALHYGFWENGTKSVEEALLNENKFLAETAEITSDTKVLDAGCGIGGSAIWIAKNKGAHVTGITLSERQIKKAKMLSKKSGVDDKTEFYLKDFLSTGFPDNSFDVIWAIESACHAINKDLFLKEMYRIVRKGGKIVIADAFLSRDVALPEEKTYRYFLEGLILPNIAKINEFENWMKYVGFKDIRFWNKIEEVKPSSRILYLRVLLSYPIIRLLNLLKLLPDVLVKNSRAGLAQWKLVKSGLAIYGVFCGYK